MVDKWRFGLSDSGEYWSDEEWTKRTHILALGILIAEIVIGRMVETVKVEGGGGVIVRVASAEEGGEEEALDEVQLAAVVESRTNVVLGSLVGVCLGVLRDESGRGEEAEEGILREVWEKVGVLVEWCGEEGTGRRESIPGGGVF